MKAYHSEWGLADAYSPMIVSAPSAFQRSGVAKSVQGPISREVLTWMLIWPILTLIAGQVVYFSGPAATAESYQNGAAMGGPRDSHLYLRVYYLFLLGFVLAGHAQVWAVVKNNLLVIAMLALAACSALWSTSPVITLEMTVQVGLCTLFACYLSGHYTTERLMELFIFVGVVSALLSILFVIALPSYGVFQGYEGGAWQGITNQKNALGVNMGFLLTPILFTKAHSRSRKLVYSALLLFLVYKSQSRGGWLDTAGMLLFVAWLLLIRRLRTRELALTLAITAVAVLVAVALALSFWPILAEQLGKSPSMSGRTGIYIEVWRSIMKHPLLGYGFGAFWVAGAPEPARIGLAIRWPNIGYAESGILELALQAGFLGVALVVGMIAKAVIQGMRLVRSEHYSPRVGWFLTIIVLVALTNIDAGVFMSSDSINWVLLLVACTGLGNEARHAVSKANTL
jgi:O-antigen ligase